MRTILAAAVAAAAVAGGGAVATSAQASPNLVNDPNFQQAAYVWGGRSYCWYNGWHGPGWYWCGYGWRRGFGWGGGYGWRGWVYPGWHRGYGWRGGGYGWHGGYGWRGGGWHNRWHPGYRHWR